MQCSIYSVRYRSLPSNEFNILTFNVYSIPDSDIV